MRIIRSSGTSQGSKSLSLSRFLGMGSHDRPYYLKFFSHFSAHSAGFSRPAPLDGWSGFLNKNAAGSKLAASGCRRRDGFAHPPPWLVPQALGSWGLTKRFARARKIINSLPCGGNLASKYNGHRKALEFH